MRPSELRIGNKLLHDGVVVTIDGRSIFDIWGYPDTRAKAYSPIPLSEEWFLRFGCLLNYDSNNYWNREKDFSIDFELFTSDNGVQALFYYVISKDRLKHLVYVHQLQNLYFALTGTELEMK